MNKFFPQQQRAPLGQSTSADCPDFSLEAEAGPGYVPAVSRHWNWPLVVCIGFWLVVGLIYFMK